jgi:hypothetical protein
MLNGLPPGVPFASELTLANGATGDIDLEATFAEPRSFRFYDVVLRMDDGGDGEADALAAQGLSFREGGSPTVDVTPPAAAVALPSGIELGTPWPNPVTERTTVRFALPRAGAITLALWNWLESAHVAWIAVWGAFGLLALALSYHQRSGNVGGSP